jgi:hypothetical protein
VIALEATRDSKRVKRDRKEAKARQIALQKLWQSLHNASSITNEEVKMICDGKSEFILPLTPNIQFANFVSENEPDMLADAFEQDAARREEEMQALWGTDFPKFKREDPTRQSSFKGLDRTKIPANADYLINDPIGLEIFLRLAKNRVPSHPMSAVGLSPGPAFMSYGSAVAEYGAPEAPGEDWLSDEDVDTFNAAPEAASGSDSEMEHNPWSWSLFKDNSFIKYTSMLVAEYAKLVRERSQADGLCSTENIWHSV